ncbi:MAG TPA: PilZ domain-containing protein [Thermodesulfovibrionales bacterium]|nr:PilZ domain-containing protein [Thermodesulfovibrionales bacterium]
MSGTRREARYEFGYSIEYALHAGPQSEIHAGVAANISSSGLCICSEHQLIEGQTIILRSTLPVVHQRAVVRWSRQVGESSHRSGLEFI